MNGTTRSQLTSSASPVVSIVTAAYNAESTLLDTVGSVIAQTDADWELIIVDDGSTDGTRELAEGCAAGDPRIRVITQANAGTAAARNAGVAIARAPWLCMLDADDLLLPTFLERLGAFREAHAAYDIYSAGATMLLRDGRHIPLPGATDSGRVHSVSAVDQMWESLVPGTSLMRRGVFDDVGGYRSIYSEDYDFWLRALIVGARQIYDPEVLWTYRRQEGSKTTALVREAESILSILLDARAMTQLTPQEQAECDRAIAFSRVRIDRRRLEEALLNGEYDGARSAYWRTRAAFPDTGKYLAGLVLMMLSPALYSRVKSRRMI